ncbi:MAG: prepilin peptidase [Gammaproteobacteria bacterium]|nr:prepilin peptidase [Gammaproteobacteria bacterium]
MNVLTAFQQNPVFFYLVSGILGLLVGSFLNVVIYRLPKMMETEWKQECRTLLGIDDNNGLEPVFNLVLPGSSCQSCNSKIRPLDNIPVISYLLLHGKCRNCQQRISIRYPIIELTSCLLIVAVAMEFGVSLQTFFTFLFTWSLIALTVIDLDHKLLPDSITLPFMWLGIICNLFGLFTDIESSLFGVIFGYLVLWSVFIVFKLFTGKEGMGYGDFKLLAMLGAWLGWQYLPLIIILSSFTGSIVGIGLLLLSKHKQSQPIPFGPFLAIAGFIALMYGDLLTGLYINWAFN